MKTDNLFYRENFYVCNKYAELEDFPSDYVPDSFGSSLYYEFFKESDLDVVAFWASEKIHYTEDLLKQIFSKMSAGEDHSLELLEYTILVFSYRVKAEMLKYMSYGKLIFDKEGNVTEDQVGIQNILPFFDEPETK